MPEKPVHFPWTHISVPSDAVKRKNLINLHEWVASQSSANLTRNFNRGYELGSLDPSQLSTVIGTGTRAHNIHVHVSTIYEHFY